MGKKKKIKKVLFVCLGNICRSPTAEGIFYKFLLESKLEDEIYCDSAGTAGYHTGQKADERMRTAAESRGISIRSRARQITVQDLKEFDYIIAMDDSNYEDIRRLDRESHYLYKIFRLREFSSDSKLIGVPDPYYGGARGFYQVIDILEDGCRNLLQKIVSEQSLLS